MKKPRPRFFDSVDFATLIVALLLALPATRWADQEVVKELSTINIQDRQERTSPRPEWIWAFYLPMTRFVHVVPFVLGPLTTGVALSVVRHRRSLGRRAWNAPGMIAMVGGVAIVVPYILGMLLRWQFAASINGPVSDLSNVLSELLSGATLGAWIALAIGGQWRGSKDWRDRLGRVLGCCWLAYIPWHIVHPILWG